MRAVGRYVHDCKCAPYRSQLTHTNRWLQGYTATWVEDEAVEVAREWFEQQERRLQQNSEAWPFASTGNGYTVTPGYGTPPDQPEDDDGEEEYELALAAQEALTTLVKGHPTAILVLLRAIENGQVDGGTYANWGYLPNEEKHVVTSACIVGWVMFHIEEENEEAPSLQFVGRSALEDYVEDVEVGETHLTNFRLAVLHYVLMEYLARIGIERLLEDLRLDEPELVTV